MTPLALSVPTDYRAMRKCLRDLGYKLRRGKHEVWFKDGEENFVLPLTPSDGRSFANDLARLVGRHRAVFEATAAQRERIPLEPAPELSPQVVSLVREKRRAERQTRRTKEAKAPDRESPPPQQVGPLKAKPQPRQPWDPIRRKKAA